MRETEQTKIKTRGKRKKKEDRFMTKCIHPSRAAGDENPIGHAESRSFIGYESFRR